MRECLRRMPQWVPWPCYHGGEMEFAWISRRRVSDGFRLTTTGS